ncbi:MAG: YciI family protein [Hyphomicrobiaceae bacterium]
MIFVLFCLDKPHGGRDIRRRTRASHLEYLSAHQHLFKYGGPLLGADGETVGSLMMVEVADRAALDQFLATEPYCTSGLYEAMIIRRTRQIFPELSPGALAAELAEEKARLG